MEFSLLVEQLERNSQRIQALAAGVSAEQARRRSDPQSWSILEVINHLYDEEREDFRLRLDLVLHNPDEPWPPNDPAGWVTERNYNERELFPSVQNFLQERKASLDWLNSLDAPAWETSAPTPWGERLSAGEIFASWVVHDLLHIRQLVELQHALIVELTAPYRLDYAGPW
jgi:hypothetical protein